MAKFLGQYENNYIHIFLEEESNYSKTYKAFNKYSNQDVFLKVINKERLKLGEYNFLLKQLEREENIAKLCQYKHIQRFYQKLETPENIIFEYELFENNLYTYVRENGELERDLEFFKYVVLTLGKVLKIIHEKGVIHRDIKPSNIMIDEDAKRIKLGGFECSILAKDNDSKQIGTLFYNAPEIIKNGKYDAKCDLWSLGVTLYELYFGELPYGDKANIFDIKQVIYNGKHFLFKKSKIPTLDILFSRLLVINPVNRMSFNEFFYYISSNDFMKKGVILVNNNLNYKYIYENNLKEIKELEEYYKKNSQEKYEQEFLNINKTQKENIDNITKFIKNEHLPDIMDFSKRCFGNHKFNNIIYYNENINDSYQDSDYFERYTPGAFILCNNEQSLYLIIKEILKKYQNDQFIRFNLITTGSTFEKIMNVLYNNPQLNNCILNSCIFCSKLEKYEPLKNKYKKLYGIYNNPKELVNNFIEQLSSREIKPFPITKLITYDDYIYKYKDRHFKISKLYGDLSPETYKKYYKELISVIEMHHNSDEAIINDLTINLEEDIDKLSELLIKKYTKNTIHEPVNKWLMSSDCYESIEFFTAKLMFALNSYAKKKDKFYKNQKKLYRGTQIPYSSLLPYERAKKKKICFSAFTSTTPDEKIANNFSERGEVQNNFESNLKFSVVFEINNVYQKGWVSNGIDIQNISYYENEEEVLFQPFSFYYVEDVIINLKQYTAVIKLTTIGKKEILEEKIKNGNEIIFNPKENIIDIKQRSKK